MISQTRNLQFGTCSWNYDSWVGLVYSKKEPYSAAYLNEYGAKYGTVEVDSWFYKIPDPEDAREYRIRTQDNFTFACKLSESLSLTHERSRDKTAPLVPNPTFLSVDLYAQYLEAIKELTPRVFLLELEFEYLNRQKMPGVDAFMKEIGRFVGELETSGVGRPVPLAIETRNGNYLTRDYFRFLKDHGIAHVFSEKLYMPHIYEVYEKVGDLIGDRVAIRLLGGDRREIEEKTKGNWNEIVDPKPDLATVAGMISDLSNGSRLVKVYLNNHYEGSAPKSIERLESLLRRSPT
jgi:uncharacterized protein YecE (DUF72 family)